MILLFYLFGPVRDYFREKKTQFEMKYQRKRFRALFFYKNGKKVKHLIDSTERSLFYQGYLPSNYYLMRLLSHKSV